MLLLDHGGPIARLALLDDSLVAGPVAINIAMALAYGDAGAHRTSLDADFVRQRRSGHRADGRGNQQNLLHFVLLQIERGIKRKGTRRRSASLMKKTADYRLLVDQKPDAVFAVVFPAW